MPLLHLFWLVSHQATVKSIILPASIKQGLRGQRHSATQTVLQVTTSGVCSLSTKVKLQLLRSNLGNVPIQLSESMRGCDGQYIPLIKPCHHLKDTLKYPSLSYLADFSRLLINITSCPHRSANPCTLHHTRRASGSVDLSYFTASSTPQSRSAN